MVERPRELHPAERFAALVAAAIALSLNVAAAIALFAPQTTFGYRLIYSKDFQVVAVDAGTAADRARIVAGDHLDFKQSRLHDRIVGLGYQLALVGEPARFVVVHGGRERSLTLKAASVTPSESQEALFSPLASFLRLAGFGYIVVALYVLLRRPNRMTWGLLLYLVSATDVTLYRFPESVAPMAAFASDLLGVAGTVGLVIFAARFPDDRAVGWRASLDRLAIPLGVLLAIPNIAWDARSLFAGESPTFWMSYGSTLGALALIFIAAIMLVATYSFSPRLQRQRLYWATAGVFFSLLSYASGWARYWPTAYSLATSDVLQWAATLLYACAPFAIAYGVVRQRVFDISFVVSRTLVYTIVTATVFGVFALVEWLAGRQMEHAGLAVALVAVIAVGTAFSLRALHARVEAVVEGTLFRRRREAERHLAVVAAGLPCAPNAASVKAALVYEPLHAYALGSADLFERDDRGDYVRGAQTLDPCIALQLQGVHRSLRLHDGTGVLAVPVFVRSTLTAIAVYGAHENGEDIDPDEAASLEAMAAAAGQAYDHLETVRMEREIARWRKVAARQARELAALRDRIALLHEKPPRDPA